jgi:8-oxo-dGTP diphosphatase
LTPDKSIKQSVIFAAGGIISKLTPEGTKILVIHRSRYNDWCLPKGKLNKGESFKHAALREVKKETSFDAAIRSFAGCVFYTIKEKPKVVLYWNLEVKSKGAFKPSEEVKEIQWLKISNALKILDYPKEKDLLMKFYKIQSRGLLLT